MLESMLNAFRAPDIRRRLLFVLVILVMRWPVGLRVAGVVAYVLGAVGPLLLHAMLTVPVLEY